jgi:hypothetical protein
MSVDPRDAFIGGVLSNCCQAPVLLGDICFECGEHCETEYENDEPSTCSTPEPTPLENWQRNDEHNVT